MAGGVRRGVVSKDCMSGSPSPSLPSAVPSRLDLDGLLSCRRTPGRVDPGVRSEAGAVCDASVLPPPFTTPTQHLCSRTRRNIVFTLFCRSLFERIRCNDIAKSFSACRAGSFVATGKACSCASIKASTASKVTNCGAARACCQLHRRDFAFLLSLLSGTFCARCSSWRANLFSACCSGVFSADLYLTGCRP